MKKNLFGLKKFFGLLIIFFSLFSGGFLIYGQEDIEIDFCETCRHLDGYCKCGNPLDCDSGYCRAVLMPTQEDIVCEPSCNLNTQNCVNGTCVDKTQTNTPTSTNTSTCSPACNEDTEKCVDGKCECDPSITCCGVKLNTMVPFIGNCIEMTTDSSTASIDGKTTRVNALNAFPVLMSQLSKILVTAILVLSFVAVIAGGVMMAGDGAFGSFSSGKSLIIKVIVGLILLGASGLILKLINPNFFG